MRPVIDSNKKIRIGFQLHPFGNFNSDVQLDTPLFMIQNHRVLFKNTILNRVD
jgi:hypothetical protein